MGMVRLKYYFSELYASGYDFDFGLMPVTVDSGQVVEFNLRLDHAVY